MKQLRNLIAAAFFLCSLSFLFGQGPSKPITNDDVVKMVKAGLPADTIALTIVRSKTAFDTSPDAIIHLNQNGVSGSVLNAVLNSTQQSSTPSLATGPSSPCPSKSGVYFNDGGDWKPLYEAASAGSKVAPVFGGAKSSVVYIGHSALVLTSTHPSFCFREIKPDLGMTLVRLDQKKDHRELQTGLYSGLLTQGVGNGVKLKNIIHAIAKPADGEDDVTLVQLPEPLVPGQYIVLSQNPIFASMPSSVPMSMRVGVGFDFEAK